MSDPRVPTNLNPTRALQSGASPLENPETNPTSSFSSLMQDSAIDPEVSAAMINPMQLAQMATAGPSNPHTILAQMQMIQDNMANVKEKISNPKIKLDNSQKSSLKKKLSSANANIEEARVKLGAPFEKKSELEEQDSDGSPGPVGKFLGMLCNGIDQLESAKRHVKTVSNKGQLSPGDFLMIQISLAKASQEIEFTGVLLSKTLDGFKQLMNVQI